MTTVRKKVTAFAIVMPIPQTHSESKGAELPNQRLTNRIRYKFATTDQLASTNLLSGLLFWKQRQAPTLLAGTKSEGENVMKKYLVAAGLIVAFPMLRSPRIIMSH